MQDRLDQTLIDGVGVLYLSCFEMLFILSSFLMTTPWDPYYVYFYSGFSGLLPLAVRSPCKVLYVFLVVLQGGSGVGCPTCSVNNYSWFPHGTCSVIPLSSALLSPYARGVTPTGHTSLCSVTWLLAAGYYRGCSPALEVPYCGVYVQVCMWKWYLIVFKKNHILLHIVNMVPRGPWILYENRHLLVHAANFLSFQTELR